MLFRRYLTLCGSMEIRRFVNGAAKFDRANPETFEIPRSELIKAENTLKEENPSLYKSLCLSRDLAKRFAERQKQSFDDFEIELSPGMITGQRTIPVDRAGVYIPAGRFPLFSCVIMGSVPAKAAGVSEVIFVYPSSSKPCKSQSSPGRPPDYGCGFAVRY